MMIVKPKRRETTGAPTADDLAVGELAINLADGTLYSKNSSNTVIQLKSVEADLFSIPESLDLGGLTSQTDTRDLGALS